MRYPVAILSEYLDVDPVHIKDLDNNLFEDDRTGEVYYVFEELAFLEYIKDVIVPDEIEVAEFELRACTKHSRYNTFYRVDEDEIEEYCLVNTEEVLDTEERQRVTFDDDIWLILKAKTY